MTTSSCVTTKARRGQAKEYMTNESLDASLRHSTMAQGWIAPASRLGSSFAGLGCISFQGQIPSPQRTTDILILSRLESMSKHFSNEAVNGQLTAEVRACSVRCWSATERWRWDGEAYQQGTGSNSNCVAKHFTGQCNINIIPRSPGGFSQLHQ